MKEQKKRTRKNYTLETKANAKRLYLIGLTLAEVSKLVDAPIKTIEKWRCSDNWTKEKETTAIHLTAYKLYKSGKTYSHIATVLKKSKPTIWRYINKAKLENEKV